MKKVIRTIAVVAIMIATSKTMANEPKLVTNGSSKNISFKWETQLLNASLKIYNNKGIIAYSDYVKNSDDYAKTFNLSALTEGAYFLKIENGTKEIIYSLRLNKNNIAILGVEESSTPGFRRKDGRVYLNFLNSKIEPVEVSVTDTEGNVLFKETFKKTFIVQKAFNFRDAFKGDYTIALKSEDDSYYETVSVE